MSILRRLVLVLALTVLLISAGVLSGILNLSFELDEMIVVISAGVAGVLALLSGGLEVRAVMESWNLPEPEEPPRSAPPPLPKDDPIETIEQAMRSVEDAEDFAHRTNGHIRVSIDVDVDESDDETEL